MRHLHPRRLLAVLLFAFVGSVSAHEVPAASAASAAKMRQAVERVIAALPEPNRALALKPFEDRNRTDWHYIPRSREGLPLKDIVPAGREAVHQLLRTALSATGYRKLTNILELELVLREIEATGWTRDPERYYFTVFGKPDQQQPWGWRFEGHHLSLNFTLAGDHLAVDTPSFFGANPATVESGPKKGLRALGAEHDAGWALLESLSEAQRKTAVFSTKTYGDIVTGSEQQVKALETAGIAATELNAAQQKLLWLLVETYACNFEPGLAEARLARAHEGTLRFAWAGSTQRGRPHYYRLQSPLILIEYDASQNGSNHIHTVWRDFSGDFGRDLLREHYAAMSGSTHRHSNEK